MAKLLILTDEPENFVPQELEKQAKAIDLDVEIIEPSKCYIAIDDDPYISYDGTKFTGADFCIPRMSEENMEYKVAIMKHLAKMGIKLLNTGQAMQTASNKVVTQILLNDEDILTPKSVIITTDEQLENAVQVFEGKFPLIIKTIHGTHGIGVIRADSMASLRSIVQQLLKSKIEFMLQEYIDHKTSGRIILLGDKVLIAAQRSIPEGDFRSNAHQGAELTKYEPTEKEVEIAKKAAECLKIVFAAVDFITVDDKVIVLEVNGSPGFEAMQKVADFDIAEKVLNFVTNDLEAEVSQEKEETKDNEPAEPKGEGPTEEEEEEEEVVDNTKKEPEKKVVDVEKAEKDDKEKGEVVDVEAEKEKAKEKVDDETDNKVDRDDVIGTITSVIIKHFNDNAAIEARVDTGAAYSSINGENIKIDGNTVKFKFNDTTYKFHLLRKAKIKQADSDKVAERPVIRVDIEINGQHLRNVEFNVNERKGMKFDVLLGRQTLAQAGVYVNPAANMIDTENKFKETEEEEEEEEEEVVNVNDLQAADKEGKEEE